MTMTNEECIKMLKSKLDGNTDTSYEWCECVRLAIKALEQQPCEDAISREEALKAMCDKCPMYNCVTGCSSYRHIEKMPSVTPKPKTGHWIRRDYWSEGVGMGESYGYYYQCSECEKIIQDGYIKCDSKYCPNCGAKMEVEE